jgi:hypothetical protein
VVELERELAHPLRGIRRPVGSPIAPRSTTSPFDARFEVGRSNLRATDDVAFKSLGYALEQRAVAVVDPPVVVPVVLPARQHGSSANPGSAARTARSRSTPSIATRNARHRPLCQGSCRMTLAA